MKKKKSSIIKCFIVCMVVAFVFSGINRTNRGNAENILHLEESTVKYTTYAPGTSDHLTLEDFDFLRKNMSLKDIVTVIGERPNGGVGSGVVKPVYGLKDTNQLKLNFRDISSMSFRYEVEYLNIDGERIGYIELKK